MDNKIIRSTRPRSASYVTGHRGVAVVLDNEAHAVLTALSLKHDVSRSGLARAIIYLGLENHDLFERALVKLPRRAA